MNKSKKFTMYIKRYSMSLNKISEENGLIWGEYTSPSGISLTYQRKGDKIVWYRLATLCGKTLREAGTIVIEDTTMEGFMKVKL